MKKIFCVILFYALLSLITSCLTNNIDDPEKIGKQVFNIAKKLSNSTKTEHISNYITIEEIREMAKNEELVNKEKTRNEMTSLLKDEWISIIEKNYNKTKEKGAKYAINWQDIEYLDFIYEVNNDDGIKECKGSLYFKYNGTSYKIKTSSIYNGVEYKLTGIRGVYPQD